MRCVFPATAANAATSKANRIAGNQECRIYCLAGGRPDQAKAPPGSVIVAYNSLLPPNCNVPPRNSTLPEEVCDPRRTIPPLSISIVPVPPTTVPKEMKLAFSGAAYRSCAANRTR